MIQYRTAISLSNFKSFYVQIILDCPAKVGLRAFIILLLDLITAKRGPKVCEVRNRLRFRIYAVLNQLKPRALALRAP